MPTAARFAERRDAAVASILLLAVFLIAGTCGLLHYGAANLVRPAVILSGLTWLIASLLPVWMEDASLLAGLANGVAAATATYAGLCCLPALTI